MLQNILYNLQFTWNITPCFNDSSTIPGLVGWMGQQGENHQGQISNTKYKIEEWERKKGKNVVSSQDIGGQLQGSDGVKGAIAAKCIGQEIIGRIHDVLYQGGKHMIGILLETYTHFCLSFRSMGSSASFLVNTQIRLLFCPIGVVGYISSSI